MISDSEEIGTLRRQVADLQQAEAFRKQKILNLEKQVLKQIDSRSYNSFDFLLSVTVFN